MTDNETDDDNDDAQTKWEAIRLQRAQSEVERRSVRRQHDMAQTHWSDWEDGRYV